MGKSYDTAALRAIASSLVSTSENVESESKRTLGWICDDAPQQIKGEAAEALTEAADELQQEMIASSRELAELGQVIRNFAWALDQADAKAAALIQAK